MLLPSLCFFFQGETEGQQAHSLQGEEGQEGTRRREQKG